MALSSSSLVAANSIPVPSISPTTFKTWAQCPIQTHHKTRHSTQHPIPNPRRSSTQLHATGLSEIEPDLPEGKLDLWATGGISPDEFVYGEYDGHHTYHEGNEGTFWEGVVAEYESAEPPTGFQGLISWLFPPAIAAGFVYNVPGEYMYIGAAVFVVVFCAIEMAKPDKPHHFPPEIYNMEREARDKFIAECNATTVDIWDFSDELWDFTVKKINQSSRDD